MSNLDHGWIPGDIPPVVDNDGESDWMLVLARGFAAPVVAYYLDPQHGTGGGWLTYPGDIQLAKVRWYRPLGKVPVSLFPSASKRWVLESGVAFDDTFKAPNA